MKKEENKNLNHLRWLIKSRNKNQQCALALFELFKKYPTQWKKKEYSFAAQALVGVVFSLWRAAFLADKSGNLEKVIEHTNSFLEKVILDNAIAYTQDRNAREWTFNYYVGNARFILSELAQKWPELVPMWERKKRPPKKRWDYAQEILVQAITNFEKNLASKS